MKKNLIAIIAASPLAFAAGSYAIAQEAPVPAAAPAPVAAEAPITAQQDANATLSAQDQAVLAWAEELAKAAETTMEKWISKKEITQERLFSELYYPISNTTPTKFSSEYDKLSDRDFPKFQEPFLQKANYITFALVADRNGYIPTHNQQFSQPLTGNLAVDLVRNRTKRIFGDKVGFSAGRSQKPYLIQRYQRDTGEFMTDLSVPVHINGKHWGCVRIAYRRVD